MKKQSHFFRNIIIFLFLEIIFLSLAYYMYITYQNIEISPEYESSRLNSTVIEQSVENEMQESKSVADILEDVSKCVVGISKIKSHSTSIFSNASTLSDLGLGSGVIFSSNGYILSNYHVTGDKLSTCYITLENGITYDGSVVWADSFLDLSITKINASNLDAIKLGDSSKLKSGETVYAIGNPIGFEFRRTITSGIISATNRTIRIDEDNSVSYMTDLLQTDASINPGNSGGPLVLSNGDVIGINSVKITSAEGIGFAIPINVIKPILEKFIAYNSFEEAYLGIYAYDKEVIPYISSSSFTSGIYIVLITDTSPAISSGIKVGDIITSIDDKPISNMIELREYIYSKNPGDTITINISRGYISKSFNIVLSKR